MFKQLPLEQQQKIMNVLAHDFPRAKSMYEQWLRNNRRIQQNAE